MEPAANDDDQDDDRPLAYRDFSIAPSPSTAVERPKFRGGVTTHFPALLHAMLTLAEVDGYDHICSWRRDGRSFVVHDRDRFVNQVLPMYFRQKHFASFQKQLNLYGFQRLSGSNNPKGINQQQQPRAPTPAASKTSAEAGGEAHATGSASVSYYHAMFLRTRHDLSPDIQRSAERELRTKARGKLFTTPDPDFSMFADLPLVTDNDINNARQTSMILHPPLPPTSAAGSESTSQLAATAAPISLPPVPPPLPAPVHQALDSSQPTTSAAQAVQSLFHTPSFLPLENYGLAAPLQAKQNPSASLIADSFDDTKQMARSTITQEHQMMPTQELFDLSWMEPRPIAPSLLPLVPPAAASQILTHQQMPMTRPTRDMPFLPPFARAAVAVAAPAPSGSSQQGQLPPPVMNKNDADEDPFEDLIAELPPDVLLTSSSNYPPMQLRQREHHQEQQQHHQQQQHYQQQQDHHQQQQQQQQHRQQQQQQRQQQQPQYHQQQLQPQRLPSQPDDWRRISSPQHHPFLTAAITSQYSTNVQGLHSGFACGESSSSLQQSSTSRKRPATAFSQLSQLQLGGQRQVLDQQELEQLQQALHRQQQHLTHSHTYQAFSPFGGMQSLRVPQYPAHGLPEEENITSNPRISSTFGANSPQSQSQEQDVSLSQAAVRNEFATATVPWNSAPLEHNSAQNYLTSGNLDEQRVEAEYGLVVGRSSRAQSGEAKSPGEQRAIGRKDEDKESQKLGVGQPKK